MYKIAHRGYSEIYKDNTLDAFVGAVDNSFNMIELDIQLTKDNNVIIYHDTFINDNLISKLNLEEVQAMDADIITLSEFFKKIDYNKISIYLDVKGSVYVCVFIHKILQSLTNTKNILIGSFNIKVLERMFELNHCYNLGLITENVLDYNILQYYIDKFNIAFVSFHWTALDHQLIRFLKMKSILTFTYTCKNDALRTFIEEYDIDGIVSNIPL
jgi:glycerophosphoryl diester phosphodiesterase